MTRIKYQEAIGLEVKRGWLPARPAPSKADLVKLYIKEGRAERQGDNIENLTSEVVH